MVNQWLASLVSQWLARKTVISTRCEVGPGARPCHRRHETYRLRAWAGGAVWCGTLCVKTESWDQNPRESRESTANKIAFETSSAERVSAPCLAVRTMLS